jgi:hypothetical protein
VRKYEEMKLFWENEEIEFTIEHITHHVTRLDQYPRVFDILDDIIQRYMLPVETCLEKNLNLCNQAIFIRQFYTLLNRDKLSLDEAIIHERNSIIDDALFTKQIRYEIFCILPQKMFLKKWDPTITPNRITKFDICIYYYLMMEECIPDPIYQRYNASYIHLVLQYVYLILHANKDPPSYHMNNNNGHVMQSIHELCILFQSYIAL